MARRCSAGRFRDPDAAHAHQMRNELLGYMERIRMGPIMSHEQPARQALVYGMEMQTARIRRELQDGHLHKRFRLRWSARLPTSSWLNGPAATRQAVPAPRTSACRGTLKIPEVTCVPTIPSFPPSQPQAPECPGSMSSAIRDHPWESRHGGWACRIRHRPSGDQVDRLANRQQAISGNTRQGIDQGVRDRRQLELP